MKNAIKFYYNLDVDSIRQLEDRYYFKSGNTNYCLIKVFDNSIIDRYKIISKYPLFYLIINNIYNDIITIINNDSYVLILFNDENRNISINELYLYNNLYVYVDINPIKRSIELWSNKIDYIEYQLNQVGKKYPLLKECFSYFNGLTENSIQLLRIIEDKKINNYLMHRRLSISSTTFDFYNPLNIVFDSRIRDICEYLKSKMFYNSIYSDFINYIKYLNNDEVVFMFARLLYPSYFYDEYDLIISGKKEEITINNIIDKINIIESELKDIYQYIRSSYYFPEIEWLNKKM